MRVFVCHASEDKPRARQLCQRLREDGIEPWLDEEKLLPGQDWDFEISAAVRDSDAIIVCLSKSSVHKVGYLQKELKGVLDVAEYQPEGRIFVIPVRLEECPVPVRLSRWQYADLFAEDGYELLRRSLLAHVADRDRAAEGQAPKTEPLRLVGPSRPSRPRKIALVVVLASIVLAVIATAAIFWWNSQSNRSVTLRTGDLEVLTVPEAEVFLNGTAAGKADLAGQLLIRRIKALEYKVRASRTGYDPEERRIKLEPDVVTSVTIDLNRIEINQNSPPITGPTFVLQRRLMGHADDWSDIRGVFFQPGGQLVSWSGSIILWDPASGRQLRTIQIDSQHFFLVSHDLRWLTFAYYYSNTNSNLAAFLETAAAQKMWDSLGGVKLTPKIQGAPEAFSPDSKRVAIVNPPSETREEGTAEFWDLEGNKRLQTWRDPSIRTLAYSPDNHWIATGRSGAALWAVSTGKKVRELPTRSEGLYGVTRLVFSDDSRWLAVLTSGYVQLWEVSTGRSGSLIHIPGDNAPTFYDVVFTHDGKLLISSNNPGIYTWDVATGRQLGKPVRQTRGHLALSPDSNWLAVAADHDLNLWHLTK